MQCNRDGEGSHRDHTLSWLQPFWMSFVRDPRNDEGKWCGMKEVVMELVQASKRGEVVLLR